MVQEKDFLEELGKNEGRGKRAGRLKWQIFQFCQGPFLNLNQLHIVSTRQDGSISPIVNCLKFSPAYEKDEKRKITCMKIFWMKIEEKRRH